MGRIAINDADKYVSQGKGGADFFQLKEDGDTARVRFMYNDINDVEMDVVHQIEVNGKPRFVNCLRSYDEPADACPLCKAGEKQSVKMFIPLFDEDDKKVKIWTRGRSFANKISGFASRYNPVCGTIAEIQRQGKKGDQKTDYAIWPGKSDDTTMDDLPEAPKIIGGYVLDKNFDELTNFVEHGSFEEASTPKRRF